MKAKWQEWEEVMRLLEETIANGTTATRELLQRAAKALHGMEAELLTPHDAPHDT